MGSSLKKPGIIAIIFLLITAGLVFIDLNRDGNSMISQLTSVLSRSATERTITDEILQQTTLQTKTTTEPEQTSEFFSPYLKLPGKEEALQYRIEGTNITIYEVHNNPLKTIKELTNQEAPDYRFNVVNSSTFFLNQQPSSQKTHNFLAIVINDVLYGFQYRLTEHPIILEIIDALQKKQ